MINADIMNEVINKLGDNRIIMIGDFYQLPPVNYEDKGFLF